MLMVIAIKQVGRIFEKNNIPNHHGIDHAIKVVENTIKAIKYVQNIDEKTKIKIHLASLCHDLDDHKFFNNHVHENTISVINSINERKYFDNKDIDDIIEMINLVSVSKNKNEQYKGKSWKLIPRYSDRLEALGYEGIIRAFDYSKEKNQPFWTESTPRAKTIEELEKIATKDLFENYKGNSLDIKSNESSMMDHFYSKLLHLKIETGNPFFDEEMENRMKIIEDFCLLFGNGIINSPEKLEDQINFYRKKLIEE